VGTLAQGCKLCVKGLKEVIFITGVCPRKPACFYCPISDRKMGKDVMYANERPIEDLKDIVDEAKLCGSKGAGITGGDPLARLNRTIEVIKMLKKEFGEEFHIHLYTSLDLVDAKKIKLLEEAGLDEIRFHPEISNDKLWERLDVETKMDKGVEIPVIPGKIKETKKLITFIDGKVNFLNLNELEISDTNVNKLVDLGFKAKNDVSYGVKDSGEMAMELLDFCKENTGLNVHFCTVRLKDCVQLPKRIKRRAENVAKSYDFVTKEGHLVRGAVYLPELKPGFGYGKKVDEVKKKEKVVEKLKKLRLKLIDNLRLKAQDIEVDRIKLRLLTSIKIVEKNKFFLKGEGLAIEVTEELPTYDQFEIESEEL